MLEDQMVPAVIHMKCSAASSRADLAFATRYRTHANPRSLLLLFFEPGFRFRAQKSFGAPRAGERSPRNCAPAHFGPFCHANILRQCGCKQGCPVPTDSAPRSAVVQRKVEKSRATQIAKRYFRDLRPGFEVLAEAFPGISPIVRLKFLRKVLQESFHGRLE